AGGLAGLCPTVPGLILFGAAGRGTEVAGCPHLAGLNELKISSWLRAEDLAAETGSPHLKWLKILQVWAASHNRQACSDALLSLAELPRLQLLSLLDPTEGICYPLLREAQRVNHVLGRQVVEVTGGDDRLYPLCGDVGYGLYAGRLRDGSRVLAVVN